MSDDPRCKPKKCWHSIDAHFQEVVAISSLAFLPIQAANIMIMGVCQFTALELSKMQDKKSLTLHWRSFLGGGSDIIAGLYALKGGQYCDYGWILSCSPVIVQDARPEIGETPVTVISRMGQRAWRLPFYIYSWPITPLWIDETMQPFDCRNNPT